MAKEYTCEECGFKVRSDMESETIEHAKMHLKAHHPETKLTEKDSDRKIKAMLKTV